MTFLIENNTEEDKSIPLKTNNLHDDDFFSFFKNEILKSPNVICVKNLIPSSSSFYPFSFFSKFV